MRQPGILARSAEGAALCLRRFGRQVHHSSGRISTRT
jgi:hypothetical protein